MADSPRTARPDPDLWQRALDGDRDAFEEAVAPHREAMLGAARTSVAARKANGELGETALNPEELVGEALVRAFDGRDRYDPGGMSLRAWLLLLQQRALNRIAADEQRYAGQKAISLDEPVPFGDRYDAVEEGFYEFNQPFEVVTYEDLIPAQAPADVEIDARRPLTEEEREFLDRAELRPEQRQVVELHDEFALSLSEVSQILDYSLQDTASALNEARVHVRHWLGSTDVREMTGDDRIDSYTGRPVSENPGAPDSFPNDEPNASA